MIKLLLQCLLIKSVFHAEAWNVIFFITHKSCKEIFINLGTNRDPIARKLRLRRGKRTDESTEADQDQAKILKGMKDVALDKNNTCEDYKVESLK